MGHRHLSLPLLWQRRGRQGEYSSFTLHLGFTAGEGEIRSNCRYSHHSLAPAAAHHSLATFAAHHSLSLPLPLLTAQYCSVLLTAQGLAGVATAHCSGSSRSYCCSLCAQALAALLLLTAQALAALLLLTAQALAALLLLTAQALAAFKIFSILIIWIISCLESPPTSFLSLLARKLVFTIFNF
ncbi:hypothetical protein SLEP1_g56714 [Rubroshorea leprosula]|uniref:Uncharacterized protein n=1 Tax=Rubroshorea leprosula TaxID=152421 RepID=A0AAV5MJA9_9ROSI|nr:hypothetical protein SLEP1_g56714 [Rubroshorea leprosula]